MNEKLSPMHYVCTHQEARELVKAHDRFWVSNCGCREARGKCARSRLDLCLIFDDSFPGSGSGKRAATLSEVEDILSEAQAHHLITRPWRNDARTDTEGICFCCDDCCYYFLNPSEACDPGTHIQTTDIDSCSLCEACIDVCHFGARVISGQKLVLSPEKCLGCGLCVDVCPELCVEMIARA